MTHPTSLLADYVDGSLSRGDRAEVDAHLERCSTCRDEVRAASAARAALASLEDVPVPAGVTSRVVREARREVGEPSGSRLARRRRAVAAVAALAAAAALVAGFLVVGPFRSQQMAETSAGLAMAPSSPPDHEPGPYDLDGNYSASELTALAAFEARTHSGVRSQDLATAGGPLTAPSATPVPATAPTEANLDHGVGSIKRSAAAWEPVGNGAKFNTCLSQAGVYDHGGTLINGFEARYEGIPSYFAVLTEGPARGEPADRAVIWVMAKKNCDIVAFAQQRFPLATPSPLPSTFMNP